MQNKTFESYFKKYSEQFASYTSQKLVTAFNREVDIWFMGINRQAYLIALIREFNNRNIDYSLIGDRRSVSFSHVVYLKNNKLHRLEDLSPVEVVVIFDNYLAHKHPEKRILNPTIIEYTSDLVRFTLFGYNKVFNLDANELVKDLLRSK